MTRKAPGKRTGASAKRPAASASTPDPKGQKRKAQGKAQGKPSKRSAAPEGKASATNRRASRARPAEANPVNQPPTPADDGGGWLRCPSCGASVPPDGDGEHRPDPRRTTYAGEPDKEFRFTRERRFRLLTYLQATIPHHIACERVQCSEDTPRAWAEAGRRALEARERGEELDARAQEQADFAIQYDSALTEAEVGLVTRVHAGAKTDWRAAAWRLTCWKPREYSERYKVRELQIAAEAPIRQAEAENKALEGELLKEKLEAVREVRRNGGNVLVIGADDLIAALEAAEDLPQEVKGPLFAWLNERGFKFIEARDLGADPIGAPTT